MDEVNVAGIDLNLLVALEALLDEAHVTRAAARLGLSQPATSNALSRLRVLFDDPLLVRVGSIMRPTPRAEALKPRVREALVGIREVFRVRERFEPEHAEGSLTVAISDYIGLLLLPRLVARVAEVAPKLKLRFVAHGNNLDSDALATGEPRLSIGFFFMQPQGVRSQTLLREQFACLTRPGCLPGRLTQKRYLSLPHVLVSQRGEDTGYVDRVLAQDGLTRRIRTVVPHFLSAGAVVAEGGGVATLPRRIAEQQARQFGLELHNLPIANPSWPLVMAWHQRYDADSESAWLRAQVVEAIAAVA